MADNKKGYRQPDFVVKENTRDGREKRFFVDILFSANKEEYGSTADAHSTFSRIMLTIADSTDKENKKWVSANINISSPETNEYALVFSPDVSINKIHRAAFNWAMAEANSRKREELPDYFTYKFPTGNFKGLTPGEAITNYPDRVEEIIRFKNWLLEPKNLSKYPSNQQLVDAIDHCLDIYNRDGKIPSPEIKNSYLIWKKENRTIKRYNKAYLYDIKIELRYFDDYPFVITIRNTEIIDKELKKYGKPIVQQMRLSELNFTSFVQKIVSAYNEFEHSFNKDHPHYNTK